MGKKYDRTANRPLLKAEEGSLYGIITKSLGDNKFRIYCSDSITRVATIRGNMIRRVWMKEGDILLCSLREGDGKVCDIEMKYNDNEIKTLKEGGFITDQFLDQDDSASAQVEFRNL